MTSVSTAVPPERTRDPLFGLVIGLYSGSLATPMSVLAVGRLVTGDAGALYGTVLVTLTVVLGIGWWATRRWGSSIVRLGRSPLRWLPAVLGGASAFAWLVTFHDTGVSGTVGFSFGLFAMLAGFALGVMLRTRYTDTRLTGVERDRKFQAGWPRRARHRARVITGTAAAVAGVAFVAGFLADVEWLRMAGQILFPAVIGTISWGDKQTYTVSPAGLEAKAPVARRLFRWDDFDGYRRTDDALVLHRRGRFDLRFALADLDDPDTVEAAIARYLPAN